MVGLALTGCGESEKEKYVDDYKPLNERLLKVGESLGAGLGNASDRTNAQLAEQFKGFASDLEDVNKDIEALDPPAELEGDSKTLTERVDVVVKDAEAISKAAQKGDAKAAAAATMDLAEHSNRVNQAQNKLARATGAKVGER
jgi:methionyl-tRNA synthetase